jgi:hypothetical protein
MHYHPFTSITKRMSAQVVDVVGNKDLEGSVLSRYH